MENNNEQNNHEKQLKEFEVNLHRMRIDTLSLMDRGLAIIKNALCAGVPYERVAVMIDRMSTVLHQEHAIAEVQHAITGDLKLESLDLVR